LVGARSCFFVNIVRVNTYKNIKKIAAHSSTYFLALPLFSAALATATSVLGPTAGATGSRRSV